MKPVILTLSAIIATTAILYLANKKVNEKINLLLLKAGVNEKYLHVANV